MIRVGRVLLASLGLTMAAPASGQEAVVGRWGTPGLNAVVELAPCVDTTTLCGTIRWLWDPVDERGQPRRDSKNADSTKQTLSLVGLEIMSGLRPMRDGAWEGRVYNPEDGQTYRATLRTQGPDTLLVEGCVLFICRKQVWRRASAIASALR